MPKYHRLSLAEREEISRSLAQGQSLRQIAAQLGRSPSTISREISHLPCGQARYRAVLAHKRTLRKRSKQGRKRSLKKNPKLRQVVLLKLRSYWSPEQIVNYLKARYPQDLGMQVSHEAIYNYLYTLPVATKYQMSVYLRRQRRWRKPRSSRIGKNPGIPALVSISKRPKEALNRLYPGHWEGDTLTGKQHQSALGTLVERTSRTTLLVPLPNHHAPAAWQAFAKKIKQLPKHLRKTLTYDRGREMAEHQRFTKATQMPVYFCDPQSPWQRGTNENTNGLIRQFFPKGTDFTKITLRQIKTAQDLLNNRPRKILGWKTPREVLTNLLR